MTSDADQDVVDLLRDRIRNNAADLLARCESREKKQRGGSVLGNVLSNLDRSTRSVSSHHDTQTPVSLEEEKKDDSLPSPVIRGGTLTKRLQKLALDRERVNQRERLRIIQADTESHLSSAHTFDEMPLPDHLLKAIFEMGFDRPSAIQEETLPRILLGRNLLGQAPSGSGKSAAFTLGMLYRIKVNEPATTQALCVTPTRELAIQVVELTVRPMAVYMDGFRVRLAISGEQLERGQSVDAHMVVGTPGKVVDWLKRRIIDASKIKVFVLDEADHMVDESGHRANSLLIAKALPKFCQSLLFSATFPPLVVEFANKMVKDADQVLMDSDESLIVDVIKQLRVDTRSYAGGKILFLADIYSLLTLGQSIVFVNTRDNADLVQETLAAAGYTCSVLHSAMEAEERDRTMIEFRTGKSTVLITTNVLARGVDVDNVCLVVNYNVPVDKQGLADYETYLHRIGRTGRFGRKGTAINLYDTDEDAHCLDMLEEHFCQRGMIASTQADPEALAEVIEI